jgi:hypothetical protein
MFRQTGQHLNTEPNIPGSCLLCARGVGGDGRHTRSGAHGLPSFVSSAPPRSEGEALLRRIFSRGELGD